MNWLLLIIPVVKIITFLDFVNGFLAITYLIDDISDHVIPPRATIIIALLDVDDRSDIFGGTMELNSCFLELGTRNDCVVGVDKDESSRLFQP